MKEKSILLLIFCGTSLRVLAVFTFYGISSSRTAAADIFHVIIHVIIECTECSILEAIYVTTYKYTRNINCSYSKYLFKDSTCLPFHTSKNTLHINRASVLCSATVIASTLIISECS